MRRAHTRLLALASLAVSLAAPGGELVGQNAAAGATAPTLTRIAIRSGRLIDAAPICSDGRIGWAPLRAPVSPTSSRWTAIHA